MYFSQGVYPVSKELSKAKELSTMLCAEKYVGGVYVI